ncbi:MAG: hypothetical protein E7313_04090 [Clostridiales bacterium]|nr:hypothetical protein [Clostridiales bacterium]
MNKNENLNEEIYTNNEDTNQNNKSKDKKIAIILISIIIVLILAIGIGVGLWFAGDTTKIINNTEQIIKTEEKNVNNKLDETKSWVYDAEYNKENKIVDNKYNFNNDVVVPYININSKDAEKVNSEIKNIYEEAYLKFGSKETAKGVGNNSKIIYSANYKYYENDNIISIVLEVASFESNGGTRNSKLYTYNFNTDTLNLATLSEISRLCGFSSANDVNEKIVKWEKSQYEYAKANPGVIAEQLIGVVDGQFFVDLNKKLNFIYICEEAGTYYKSEIVDANTEIKDFYDMSVVEQPSNSNNNQEIIDQNSRSDFSDMKVLKNTIYEGKFGEYLYKFEYDEKFAKPVITVCRVQVIDGKENSSIYGVYNEYSNIKFDAAAGSVYVTFDYKNAQGEIKNGEVKYSNIDDNQCIYLKLTDPKIGQMIELYKEKRENTSNNNQEIIDQSSRSDFSDMKVLKNKIYEGKSGEYLYKFEYDEKSAKPTITVNRVQVTDGKENSSIYGVYNEYSNIKFDAAAGSVYVTFDYKNAQGEIKNGEVKYSNVDDNQCIYLKLNDPEISEMIELKSK